MPRFEVTGPNGQRYEVNAPEGASEADVLAHAKAEASKTPDAKSTVLSKEDRRAYLSYPLTREGDTQRAEMEQRYGGRDAFLKQLDPHAATYFYNVELPLILAATGLAGPSMVAAYRAPGIARTFLGREIAQGTVPTAVEPTLAQVAKIAMQGVSKAGSALKAGVSAAGKVAEHPLVKYPAMAAGLDYLLKKIPKARE